MSTISNDEKHDTAADASLHESPVLPGTTTWSTAEEKKLVRKLDMRIFPVLVLLFILNFIDRGNFANARLKGLQADLNLSDVQYQTCISILLVGYVTMQVPSNMVLNYISRPSIYICGCVTVWGLIAALTGVVTNATGAILCRFFLRCVEASCFPGSIYFLSRWYTREEMSLRVTILNGGNLAAQAFGGLIAAGILTPHMDQQLGIAAWRWLFIIEGSITVFLGLLVWPVLPDYPQTTRWLTETERFIAQQRLVNDVGAPDEDSEKEPFTRGLYLAVTDSKVWLLAITYHLTIMGLSFSYFFPSIALALGYGTTATLLLTAPPWIWALLVALPNAWHADKSGERFFHYLWPASACIIGYIISMTTTVVGARYFAMFLMATGYACGFLVLTWISNTIPRSPAKRAAAIGIINACGNIGSIPGSYIWAAKYAPQYVVPFGACIGIFSLAIVFAFVLRQYLVHLNKKLDREEGVGFEASSEVLGNSVAGQNTIDQAVGQQAKAFRYLY